MKKMFDLSVKTRSYVNKNGETKNVWDNIGSLMEGDKGGFFITMKRTFNPAGVPNPDNKDSVIISCFKPKDKEAPAQNGEADFFADDATPFG